MQRGKRIFETLTKENQPILKKNKGRSKQLLKERNICIACRYFYYAKIQRLRFEDVLAMVSSEFFISERTLSDIIGNKNKDFKEIFNQKPSINSLKEKYKFFRW